MKSFGKPKSIVTDGLASYGAAMKDVSNKHRHEVGRWKNNRGENSHLMFRRQEKGINKFRSMDTLRNFVDIQAQIQNHFNGERHLTNDMTISIFALKPFLSGSKLLTRLR